MNLFPYPILLLFPYPDLYPVSIPRSRTIIEIQKKWWCGKRIPPLANGGGTTTTRYYRPGGGLVPARFAAPSIS